VTESLPLEEPQSELNSSVNPVPQASIKKRVVRGTLWTVAGYGASQLLRFGNNLILTRLLFPELFGLMTLVYVFISGLHMFSDIGVGVSVIQSKRGDDPKFLNTAWTLQVGRGLVLWLACLVLAYPVAQIYNEPRLLWLIPVVGLSTLISGFNATTLFTLNRHLAVKEVAFFEFSTQIVGTVVILLWAWVSPTVWALVAGNLISTVYYLALSHALGPIFNRKGASQFVRNRFTWDKTAVTELVSFGIWIFLSTAMTFFGEQADRLILGKIFDFTLLGIYGIALTLADLPRSVTNTVGGKVLMPALSMMADQPRSQIRVKIARQRKRILPAMALGLAIMACFGDMLIELLYDERYLQASWMLPILALGIWPRLLCNTIEPVLFAIGRPQYTAAANLSRFICTSIGVLLGYRFFQLPGAIVGIALNDLFYYLVISYGLWREGLANLKQDGLATALLVVFMAGLVLSRITWGLGTPLDVLWGASPVLN
jgi:O-antigen/teichoic acid export membrane protein